jgi:hypothetical protein
VWGKELFFDATPRSKQTLCDGLPGSQVGRGGALGRPLCEGAPAEDDQPITGDIDTLPSAGDADLRERNAAKKDWISRDGAQDRSFRGTPWRERTSDTRASKTDPDARRP